jgi:hypothetical protein
MTTLGAVSFILVLRIKVFTVAKLLTARINCPAEVFLVHGVVCKMVQASCMREGGIGTTSRSNNEFTSEFN